MVDHVGNSGGGSRFLRALLPALRRERRELEITLFANEASMERDGLVGEFAQAGVQVKALRAVRPRPKNVLGVPGTSSIARRIQARTRKRFDWLPARLTGNLQAELQLGLRGYDVAYFPWPYGLQPPQLACPMVATIHDLNFKYFFGSEVFSARTLSRLEPEMAEWMERAGIVTSSRFMAEELRHFYPHGARPGVVRLAPFTGLTNLSDPEAREHVRSLGVLGRYLLYPTHGMTHKNLGPLIASVPLLRDEFPDLKLVFTGNGTQTATGKATSVAVERNSEPVDVIGLGYVSNDQMDSLIRCATVVVSSSLYETGNGPGLDAWLYGVPVAMSDIPEFREHMEVQGVWAVTFDPRDPRDIAAKIASILRNENDAAALASASAAAIRGHTWGVAALGYLAAFDRALLEHQPRAADVRRGS